MDFVSFRDLREQSVEVDRGIFVVARFKRCRRADHERLLVPGIDFKRLLSERSRLHEA